MRAAFVALFVIVLWAAPSHAQDAGVAAAPATAAPPSATPAAPPAAAPAAAAPSAPDLGKQLEDAKKAYDRLKRDQTTPRKFLIAALIAAIANVLLTVFKKTTKMSKKAKKYLPWISVGLGFVIGVSSYYAMGTTLVDAVLYGGGAPGAVILQELLAVWKKDADSAA